jgi:hypothetical protein
MHIFRIPLIISFFHKNLLLVLIIVLASSVFLTNLGGQGYSLDESLTVAVAKTILIDGYPSAWDGQMFLGGQDNIFTTVIHGIYFWTWYPWLQFYLIAPVYLFFGNAIALLRFPFALFGVATVVVLYLITVDLFKKKWLGALLAIQLIFLMPFFLYVRQVHYYSPSAFFSVLLFWLLLRFSADKFNKKLTLLFLLTSLLLLMTNSLIWLSCLPAFILLCLVRTYKKYCKHVFSWKFIFAVVKNNKSIISIILLEGLLAFLWFHIFAPFGGINPVLAYAAGRPNVFIGVIQFLSYGNNFVFPLIIFPLTVFTAWKLNKLKYLWIIAFWIGSKLVIYSLLIIPHGRFMTDSMPLCMLFFGFVYYYLSIHRQTVLILTVFFVAITTNIFALAPAYLLPSHQRQFRFYPNEFASELTGEYPPAYLQISEYLSKNSKPGDLFWSNYNVLEIYLYSNVPAFSTALCRTHSGVPVSFSWQKQIKWYIFYQGRPQSLREESCLGPKWQTYMEDHYIRRIFPLNEHTYPMNDPDIVNRQFPPLKIPSDSVVIYERK